MKFWPLPNSFEEQLPREGERGSFWEDRQIGFNCGIELTCPTDSEVFAIEGGVVLNIDEFTTKSEDCCFENTKQCVIKCNSIIYKYSFLSEVSVKLGSTIKSGEKLGVCKDILIPERIHSNSPFYLRELTYNNLLSILHIEIFKSPIMEVRPYKYGNFTGEIKPHSIINPLLYLSGLSKMQQI